MTATQHAPGRPVPWSSAETVRVLALVVLGFVVVIASWWSLAGKAAWDDQVPAIGAAVAGFALGSFGAVSWLLRARAEVVARRRALLPELAGAAELTATPADHDPVLVADRTRGRYHRGSCPLAAGRTWRSWTRAELLDAGREPCGVCQP